MTEEKLEALQDEKEIDLPQTDDTMETEQNDVEQSDDNLIIEKLQAENDALADKVLRAQAELQNVQRRQVKERQDLLKYRSQKLAESLLPVLDSLERALVIEATDDQSQALKKGIQMAYDNFMLALKEEGIEKVGSLNEPFNPTVHQAIQQVPSQEGQSSDTVVQVYQDGYTLHERVIRPAMVVVTQ